MNDAFPNAAPPPGALFDNVPNKPAYFREPPDTLTPAVRISQGRDGKWYTLHVTMQYGAPISLDLALRRVAIGRTVFVAREDAETVMESLRPTTAGPASLTGT